MGLEYPSVSRRPNPDLEELFAQREQIDRALTERLARDVTVMFTDIVGSTEYFERRGDLEGVALLERHNKLLFPIVQGNGGRVVKTIGDAIMAVFDTGIDGVRAAAAMQKAIEEYRRSQTEDPLHIKIGLHGGKALLRDGDVFGDTVNTAARIGSKARGDEILLSESLFRSLPPDTEMGAAPRGSLELRGKSERIAVMALEWRPGASVLMETRGFGEGEVFEPTPVSGKDGAPSQELFVLELAIGANGLKVTALDGAADKGTVKAYEETPLSRPDIDRLAAPFSTFMHGGGTGAYLDLVRGHGAELFQRTLSGRARGRINSTSLRYLRLHLDDELVHVPWELMHDGREFLALRFAMGRMVSARGTASPEYDRPSHPGVDIAGHALVVSNPSGGLDSASHEGKAVAALLREGFRGEVKHVEGPVTRAAFLAALGGGGKSGCRILHFAGHAQRSTPTVKGGLLLADGVLTPDEICDAVGNKAPPLVFVNGCHASTSRGWIEAVQRTSSLASAFLMRGARHYIGPMWEIPDGDGLAFALRFYESALSGAPFGDAVRESRRALAASHQEPLSFAGYVLYGEPRTGFPAGSVTLEPSAKVRSAAAIPLAGLAIEEAIAHASGANTKARRAAKDEKAAWLRKGKSWFLRLSVLAIALEGGSFALQAWQMRQQSAAPATAAPAVAPVAAPLDPANAVPARVAAVANAKRREGPVRIGILPFKTMSGAEDIVLSDALAESVMTDFGDIEGVKLIERQQVTGETRDLKWSLEFENGGLVDPATRAAIGKLEGAEVVVIGGYQRSGKRIRANARFVDSETGEVLHALKAERDDGDVLALQDDLSKGVHDAVGAIKGKLRP